MSAHPNKYDFTGKVALVTGSSSGIGVAIARQFARYGARVAITGRNAERLEAVANDIQKAAANGERPLVVIGDFADHSFPKRLINETVTHFGRLDILVNNAGSTSQHDRFDDEQIIDDYDKVFGLNVRSILHLTQLAAAHLQKANNGNVINISGAASMRPFSLVYSASKAALDMVTKMSAVELAPKGIRVNSINPGPVETPFVNAMGMEYQQVEKSFKNLTLLDRVATTDDIANLATFLASDDAVNITGSIMITDGGCLLKTVPVM